MVMSNRQKISNCSLLLLLRLETGHKVLWPICVYCIMYLYWKHPHFIERNAHVAPLLTDWVTIIKYFCWTSSVKTKQIMHLHHGNQRRIYFRNFEEKKTHDSRENWIKLTFLVDNNEQYVLLLLLLLLLHLPLLLLLLHNRGFCWRMWVYEWPRPLTSAVKKGNVVFACFIFPNSTFNLIL